MGKTRFYDLIVTVHTFLLTLFLFQLEEFDLFGASREPDSLVAGVFVQIVKTGTVGSGWQWNWRIGKAFFSILFLISLFDTNVSTKYTIRTSRNVLKASVVVAVRF